MDPWFTEQTAGIVGGIMGSAIGVIWGGIAGPLTAALAPQGKGKGLVLGLWASGFVVGLGLLATGGVALFNDQPWYVTYAFGGAGLVLATLTGALFPVIAKRYRQAEQRALAAEEIRRA